MPIGRVVVVVEDADTGKGVYSNIYVFANGGLKSPELADYSGYGYLVGFDIPDGDYTIGIIAEGYLSVDPAQAPPPEWEAIYTAAASHTVSWAVGPRELKFPVIVGAPPPPPPTPPMVKVNIRIESYQTTDTYARFHGKAVDQSLDSNFYETQPGKVIGTAGAAGLIHEQTVDLAEGTHYVIYGNSGYVPDYAWHAKIYINGGLVAEGDVGRRTHLRADFTVVEKGWNVEVTVNVEAAGRIRPAGEGEVEVMLEDIGEGLDYRVYNVTGWRSIGLGGKIRFSYLENSWIVGFDGVYGANRFNIHTRLTADPATGVSKELFLGTTDWR